MKITLYGGTYFDRSGKIRWLLEELGLEYRNHWLETDEDYEKFLQIAPLGRTPAIMIDDQLMIESGAIGERIRVLNPSSRAAVEAEVIGPDRVRVAPSAVPMTVSSR